MTPIAHQLVPLTDDEKAWLWTIYKIRYKNLFIHFFCTIFFVGYLVLSRFGYQVEELINIFIFGPRETWLVNAEGWYLKVIVIVLISIGSSTYSYFVNMAPYKADAISGIKAMVPLLVVKKEYFPVTDQYFLWLEGVDERHFEVDITTFNSVLEGDKVLVRQAIKSKYIFSDNNVVSL